MTRTHKPLTVEQRRRKQELDRQYRARNRDKTAARRKVQYAIERGKLVRQPCERCGGPSEAHHADYSQPLVVSWLCKAHHRELHRKTIAKPKRPTIGELQAIAKQRAVAFRERFLAGESITSMAKAAGLSRQRVSQLCRFATLPDSSPKVV